MNNLVIGILFLLFISCSKDEKSNDVTSNNDMHEAIIKSESSMNKKILSTNNKNSLKKSGSTCPTLKKVGDKSIFDYNTCSKDKKLKGIIELTTIPSNDLSKIITKNIYKNFETEGGIVSGTSTMEMQINKDAISGKSTDELKIKFKNTDNDLLKNKELVIKGNIDLKGDLKGLKFKRSCTGTIAGLTLKIEPYNNEWIEISFNDKSSAAKEKWTIEGTDYLVTYNIDGVKRIQKL